MNSANRVQKKGQACNFCRRKKIRCDGGIPCPNCVEHDEECVYTPRRRRRKLMQFNHRHDGMTMDGERTAFTTQDSILGDSNGPALTNELLPAGIAPNRLSATPNETVQPPMERLHPIPSYSPNDGSVTLVSVAQSSSIDRDHHLGVSGASNASPSEPFQGDIGRTLVHDQEGSSIHSTVMSALEYHGPRTVMSICSKPGIDWVKQRAKDPDFESIASKWMDSMTRLLKIQQPASQQRKAEPSESDAWRYTRAFFKKSQYVAKEIISKPWFESKLLLHFKASRADQDPSWYALRNVIYAFGVRILYSKPGSFRDAQQAAWPWFENALSVQSQMMYWPTTLLAVQALTLMAYFTESISCPSVQSIMTPTAMRLAITKGLHRQPSVFWKLTPGEESHRSYAFWAIYCLEKLLEGRSGRPSSIQDDEISCQIPTHWPPDSSVQRGYGTAMIKLCQLSSLANKTLANVHALRFSPEESVRNVADMTERLEQLRQSLRADLQLDLPLDLAQTHPGLNNHQILCLQSTYYSILWYIHTPLVYPWFQAISKSRGQSNILPQIQKSKLLVAATSRSAILELKHIEIDANSSLGVAYYVPMYAMVNLFIHILTDPSLDSVKSDLVLLEVGAGYFARLDFETEGYCSISFPKDLVQVARNAVENAKLSIAEPARMSTGAVAAATPGAGGEQMQIDGGFNDEWLQGTLEDDFEMWSTVFASVMPDCDIPESFI